MSITGYSFLNNIASTKAVVLPASLQFHTILSLSRARGFENVEFEFQLQISNSSNPIELRFPSSIPCLIILRFSV